jgi:hypothetical protein
MLEREQTKVRWPEGRDAWNKSDKLMTMARAVLDGLLDGGAPIPAGPLRDSYLGVLSAAERYRNEPTPGNHQLPAELYDDSQDAPYPE